MATAKKSKKRKAVKKVCKKVKVKGTKRRYKTVCKPVKKKKKAVKKKVTLPVAKPPASVITLPPVTSGQPVPAPVARRAARHHAARPRAARAARGAADRAGPARLRRRRSASRRPRACCGAPASARSPARPRRSPSLGVLAAVRSLTRPSGTATLSGAAPTVERRADRALRCVGPRPPLVAGSHDPLRPAARRAHDAHLARLAGDVERRHQQPRAHARPERALSQRRPRLVRRPRHRT